MNTNFELLYFPVEFTLLSLVNVPLAFFIAKYMWNKQRLWEYRRLRGQFQTGAERKWRKVQ